MFVDPISYTTFSAPRAAVLGKLSTFALDLSPDGLTLLLRPSRDRCQINFVQAGWIWARVKRCREQFIIELLRDTSFTFFINSFDRDEPNLAIRVDNFFSMHSNLSPRDGVGPD